MFKFWPRQTYPSKCGIKYYVSSWASSKCTYRSLEHLGIVGGLRAPMVGGGLELVYVHSLEARKETYRLVSSLLV